jgi:hypothetical protein
MRPTQVFLQFREEMVVTWGYVWAVGRVCDSIASKFVDESILGTHLAHTLEYPKWSVNIFLVIPCVVEIECNSYFCSETFVTSEFGTGAFLLIIHKLLHRSS